MRPVEATKDFLTNCYAREGLVPFLKKMEEDYLTGKRPFSVLIMDVDHFKSFNDKYGHLYGDEVLKYFSSSMRLDLEDEENAPFRFGGDEFVMIFPNKSPGDAYRLASRLRKNIRTRSCLIKGHQISITFSGGIAGCPADADNIEDLLDKADKALYYSKNHGRSRITKYSDLGRKEFLQIGAILLVLAVVGGLLYHYRDPLSARLNKVTSSIPTVGFKEARTVPAAAPPETVPEAPGTSKMPELFEPPAVPVAESGPPAPPESSGTETSKIYLETGRIIQGIVKGEDETTLKVEVGLHEGKGMLQIKKSQILRIETGSKTRKFN